MRPRRPPRPLQGSSELVPMLLLLLLLQAHARSSLLPPPYGGDAGRDAGGERCGGAGGGGAGCGRAPCPQHHRLALSWRPRVLFLRASAGRAGAGLMWGSVGSSGGRPASPLRVTKKAREEEGKGTQMRMSDEGPSPNGSSGPVVPPFRWSHPARYCPCTGRHFGFYEF